MINRDSVFCYLKIAPILLLTIALFLPLSSLNCSHNSEITGTGSQAGNGRIACTIYNEDGSPAAGAVIRLRSRDYIARPDKYNTDTVSRDALTDKNGAFTIDSVDTGKYFIEVNDGQSHAVLLTCDITNSDTLVKLPKATLLPTSTIKGTCISPPNVSPAPSILIYGLERSGVYDSLTNEFSIYDVPGGNYTVCILASSSKFKPVEISTIVLSTDLITDVGAIDFTNQSTWKYSQKIYINTTSTGADVAGTVTNFPLLLRLRSGNFSFGNAKTDGGDVRFTNSKGTSLSYEIERWDAGDQEAEIWINIDTVYGNDSTQYFKMYCGNPDVTDSSSSTAVFDTANGFTSVWHLDETGDSSYDATFNSFNGKDSGCTSSAGIIGNARNFSNKSFIKVPGLLNTPSDVTLSAWAKCDTSAGVGQEIISIGDAILIRLDDKSGMGTMGSFFFDSVNYTSTNTRKMYAKTGWHYIVYTFDFTTHTQRFYIDGMQSAVTTDSSSIHYLGFGSDTYIGMHGNKKQNFNFFGQIDEARVNSKAVSADWIKLCFMNQRVDDKLVNFK